MTRLHLINNRLVANYMEPRAAIGAFDPQTGTLYLVDNSTDSLYTINMATGAATLIGSTGTGNLLGLGYINGPLPVELQRFSVE